jgi:hypothetical protein
MTSASLSRPLASAIRMKLADSQKPFPEALLDLARATNPNPRQGDGLTALVVRGAGYSTGFLGALRGVSPNSRREPTKENMERIARAAGVHPRYFREYREHMARERAAELEREIGLDKVIIALERLRRS